MEYKNKLSTFFALVGLYSLPVFGSFHYSYSKNLLFLFSSLIFITIFPLAVLIISSRLNKWLAIIVNILASLMIISSEILRLLSFYLQGEGFNERFFFHFSLATIESAWLSYPVLTWGTLFIISVLVYLAIKISLKNPFKRVSISVALTLILISPLLNSAINKYCKYQWDIFWSPIYSGNWTEENVKQLGLDSDALKFEKNFSAHVGRNLVLIYLESLEGIYTDSDVFEFLTPNINTLKKQGAFFSDIKAFPGTGWTIAGILSSQCGTPLLYDSHVSGNDILTAGFLDNATCLSDVLHNAGYRQVYFGGATHRFAGKGEFLRNHHYDEVNGLDELLSSQKDQSYRTGWGLYDDTLFELAVNKFNELAVQGKPFNLTLLTLDTHHPTGDPSQSCTPYPYIDNSMLHAVHCTDQLVNRFLKRISQHSAFENTVVVLLSDHLAMRNVAEKYYPERNERKNTFIVLNSELQGEISTTGSHMDIAPTILDLLGVEHNTSFLAGDSMLNKEKESIYDELLKNQTLAGIRHINSNILSSSSSLCQNDVFIIRSLSNNSILMGDKKVSLSYGGFAFDSIFFKNNFSFEDHLSLIIFFNDLKKIEHTLVVEKYEIPYLVSEYGSLNYILINSDIEVDVWFGRGNKLSAIDSFNSLRDIDIHLESCGETIDRDVTEWVHLARALNYEDKCKQNNENIYSVEYLVNSKILNLPSVLAFGHRFSFKLVKEKERNSFLLKNFGGMQYERVMKYDPCMPKYFQNTLFIPQLRINNKLFSVNLKQSTENGMKFIISKNQEGLFK